MAQLEPLEHSGQHGGENSGSDCPACSLCTSIFNEMVGTLEQASRRLSVDDIAFLLALLIHSIEEAAPTVDAKAFFWFALREHIFALSHGGQRGTVN